MSEGPQTSDDRIHRRALGDERDGTDMPMRKFEVLARVLCDVLAKVPLTRPDLADPMIAAPTGDERPGTFSVRWRTTWGWPEMEVRGEPNHVPGKSVRVAPA